MYSRDATTIYEADPTYDKILGQWWDREGDYLKYVLKGLNEIRENITKRTLLSNIMKIYDPLGLVANNIIESKILMQDIWRQGLDWDTKLTPNLKSRWRGWAERMQEVDDINIAQCFSKANEVCKRKLRVFVDASEKAIASVVYMRSMHSEVIDVCLVAAKSRVAPTKPLSIPRLELQAAVLGVRMAETLLRESRIHVDSTCFWTDSKTVLAWIGSEPRNYQRCITNSLQDYQFVALRIGEILNGSNVEQWHWVRTKDNPTDEATKVVKGPSIWLEGAKFLQDTNIQFEEVELSTTEEIRPIFTINAVNQIDWGVTYVKWSSNWVKLRRSLAICLKFFGWLKAKQIGIDFKQ